VLEALKLYRAANNGKLQEQQVSKHFLQIPCDSLQKDMHRRKLQCMENELCYCLGHKGTSSDRRYQIKSSRLGKMTMEILIHRILFLQTDGHFSFLFSNPLFCKANILNPR